MKVGIKQTVLSVSVFAGIMLGLVSVDARVRDTVGALVGGSDGFSSVSMRLGDFGDALLGAAQHQSIENAPLVVFAAVSAVLVLFMVRT